MHIAPHSQADHSLRWEWDVRSVDRRSALCRRARPRTTLSPWVISSLVPAFRVSVRASSEKQSARACCAHAGPGLPGPRGHVLRVVALLASPCPRRAAAMAVRVPAKGPGRHLNATNSRLFLIKTLPALSGSRNRYATHQNRYATQWIQALANLWPRRVPRQRALTPLGTQPNKGFF